MIPLLYTIGWAIMITIAIILVVRNRHPKNPFR